MRPRVRGDVTSQPAPGACDGQLAPEKREVTWIARGSLIGTLTTQDHLYASRRGRAVDLVADHRRHRMHRLIVVPNEGAQPVPHAPRIDVHGMQLGAGLLQ